MDICDLATGATELTFGTRKDASRADQGDAICGVHLFRRYDSGYVKNESEVWARAVGCKLREGVSFWGFWKDFDIL